MNFPKFVSLARSSLFGFVLIERAHSGGGGGWWWWRGGGVKRQQEHRGMDWKKKARCLCGKDLIWAVFEAIRAVLRQNELWKQSVRQETAYTSSASLFSGSFFRSPLFFCQRHFNDPGVQRREQQTGAPPLIPRHQLNHGCAQEPTSSRRVA